MAARNYNRLFENQKGKYIKVKEFITEPDKCKLYSDYIFL